MGPGAYPSEYSAGVHNPALVRHAEERARSTEDRIADRITSFAESMSFVYLHIAWFGCRIGFGVERYPFGLPRTGRTGSCSSSHARSSS